ncbi:hypothetical protein MMC19_003001 [Ptychographa xylographoides]|nr:hypothetical protein [Ptychographa xylographoides]
MSSTPTATLSIPSAIREPSCKKVVYSLLIINKAGGLVYQRDFHAGLTKLSTNDYLVLAGTFHGVHAITRSLTPAPLLFPNNSSSANNNNNNTSLSTAITASAAPRTAATGLEVLETALFRLTCFQTPSGTKFLLFTEPQQPNVDVVMRKVYELYADYVMKNPFYQLEMPVRCEAFERHLVGYVRAR